MITLTILAIIVAAFFCSSHMKRPSFMRGYNYSANPIPGMQFKGY